MLTADAAKSVTADTRSRPHAAFLLSAPMYELLYGEECRALIMPHAHLASELPGTLEPEALARAELVFTGWSGPRFDEALLDRMPRLQVVFHAGGTVRPHVSEAFWRRGLRITSAASANATPVAHYTLAVILLALKGAWRLNRAASIERSFSWSPQSARGIRGAQIGLVSLGLIGRQVRELLRGYDVHVLAYDPYLSPADFQMAGVEPVSLDHLMSSCDVISLHTPLTSETSGFIDSALLRRMKPHATLINTARGGLIREADLVNFLKERTDVQAVLDVTSPEPPVRESKLFDLENVFLTPHIAGSMGTECRRLGLAMVEELRRYAEGEPLRFTVSEDAAARQT